MNIPGKTPAQSLNKKQRQAYENYLLICKIYWENKVS